LKLRGIEINPAKDRLYNPHSTGNFFMHQYHFTTVIHKWPSSFLIELGKAYAEVGEENKQFTK
jgi:hypothetical protein